MNQKEAIKVLGKLPRHDKSWEEYYSCNFLYDSGSGFWIRSYERHEDDPTEWKVYGGSYSTIKGVFSPKGKVFTESEIRELVES